jgi:TetR/AcrR family transcriptional repressor of bet genes
MAETIPTITLKHPPRPNAREAIKAWNRQKIIDATIAVINAQGIAGTTVARVVELAEVSMGLVNLHFENKERLLEAVLRHMAERYERHWRQALADAPDDARGRIRALALADLDPVVLNAETLGVWYAFRAQARSNPAFIALVGNRDRELSAFYAEQFAALNEACGVNHSPAIVTRSLIAMLEGIWADYFLYPQEYDRARAIEMLSLFVESLYPGSFDFEK